MSEPTIPTVAEITALPRWARVAFAARCARRVLPLFLRDWPTAPAESAAAVLYAVAVATRAAATACSLTAARTAADAAAQVAAVAGAQGARAAYAVAKTADYAADAAGAADSARSSASAADYASSAARACSFSARHAIRLDYVALVEALGTAEWTDNTPVSPDFFGALWPYGAPAGWPAEDTPSEPANPQDEAQTVVPSPSRARRQREGAVGGPVFVPGDRVPHAEMWVLVELIGKGGFAQVWLARHRQTNESRAVKFCTHAVARERLPDVARHESNVASYVQQHTSTPAGGHPNIVPLYECNLRGEIPWLMYEFVPGNRSVANVINEMQALSVTDRVARSVPLLHTIACAVGQFHRLERQIVHRDLTPKNVLMDGDVPRITDFGIGGAAVTAAVADATGHTEFTVRVDTMLRSAGTPPHASTQQLAGNGPDPRDDVYALGVMAYQMLTGELGAPGADARDKLEELGVPDGLIRLIVKSVSDPSRRPVDAVEWAEALVSLLSGCPVAPILMKRNANVPGVWHSRPVNNPNAEWERIGFSTREITFMPDRVYRLEVNFEVDDSDLEGLRTLAGVVPFLDLSLQDCSELTDLSSLAGLTNLKRLDLSSCRRVTNLAPLSALHCLEELDLSFCYDLECLDPLSRLSNLKKLMLTHCDGVTDITPLAGQTGLEELGLSRCNGVTDLAPIAGLSNLWRLELNYREAVTDLAPLAVLSGLEILSIRECQNVVNGDILSGLPRLRGVSVAGTDITISDELSRRIEIVK